MFCSFFSHRLWVKVAVAKMLLFRFSVFVISLKIEFSCEEEKTLVLQFCRLDDIDRELPFLFSGWVFGWTLRYKMDFENACITTDRSLRKKIQVTQLLSTFKHCVQCASPPTKVLYLWKKKLCRIKLSGRECTGVFLRVYESTKSVGNGVAKRDGEMLTLFLCFYVQ